MKNFLIVVLLLIVAGLGAYIYSMQGNDDSLTAFIDRAKSTVTEKIEKIESTVKDVTEPAVTSLPEDTVISIDFPFKSIKPAVDHLITTVNKIRNSSIAKKLNLEEMIQQGMQSPLSSPAQLSPQAQMALSDNNSASNTAPAAFSFDEAVKVIQDIEGLNLLLRSKVVENRVAPMLHLSARFNSDALNAQIKQTLEQAANDINNALPGSIKNNPSDPDSYNIEVKAPMLPVELVGSVVNKDKEFSLKLAAATGIAKNIPASQSEAQAVISRSILSKDSFSTYFNTDNFLFLQRAIIDSLLAKASPAEKNDYESNIDTVRALLKNYKSLASSAEFKDGFKSRSCALMADNAENLASAKKAIDSRAESSDKFIKLITARTSVAASLKAASIISYLQGMLPEKSAVSADNNPQIQEATDKILLSADRLKALELREIGVIVNAPTVSFVPDYGFYLEHSGKHSFSELAAGINQLLKDLAPPSMQMGEALQVTKNAAGKEQIVITAGEYPLTLTALNDNVIIGAGQPVFLQELGTQLASSTNYISSDSLKSKNLKLSLDQNDYQVFFSPSSLTAFARQFLPFMTMAVPDLKITDAEVNEVLNLLDFNVLLTSTSSMPSDNTLCSEGQIVLF